MLHNRRHLAAALLAMALTAFAPPGLNAASAPGHPGVTIAYGSGSFGTLANFFFMASALFQDLMHVRMMLVLAYLCLMLQVALGYPGPLLWGRNDAFPALHLGNILWCSVTLALQLYGLAVLVLDEIQPRLSGDDELLWRLMYRRCGITKREFSHVLKLGRWQSFTAGELMERRDRDEPHAVLIFKGAVRLEDATGKLPPLQLASGQVLNLYLCNLFRIYLGFEHDPVERSHMVAATDCTVFSWDIDALLKMASGAVSVAIPGYWRSFLLNIVALQMHGQSLDSSPFSSSGQPEPDPDAWLAGAAQTADITQPLQPEEQDSITFKSVLHSVFGPLGIKVARGVRHQAAPKTGSMAAARVLLAAGMRQRQQALPPALSCSLDDSASASLDAAVAQQVDQQAARQRCWPKAPLPRQQQKEHSNGGGAAAAAPPAGNRTSFRVDAAAAEGGQADVERGRVSPFADAAGKLV